MVGWHQNSGQIRKDTCFFHSPAIFLRPLERRQNKDISVFAFFLVELGIFNHHLVCFNIGSFPQGKPIKID